MGSSGRAIDAIRNAAENDTLLTATAVGVPPDAMARANHDGVIERVIPGVYIGAQQQQHPLTEAAAWTVKFPSAVTCLLTAAAFHELTDAFSRGTWLFVGKGESRPRSRVVTVHAVQTAPRFIAIEHDEKNGIAHEQVHGVDVRITGPDRTTLDLWRFPHHIPQEYALDALRRRVRSGDFNLPRFARLGSRLEVWTKIEQLVQGLMLR